MPSVVLLNGPHARSNVRTAVNRLLKRCLLGSSSLARNVVSFSGRRPNTGQLYVCELFSDARQLWNKINQVINPPTTSQFTYSASDLAMHFVDKVDKIRANTASAPPPRVVDRQCASGLSTFQQVTTGEIRRLISRAPCKHCDLDPAPTWLVKRAIDVLAPVIAAVCKCVTSERLLSSVTKASPGDRAPQETFSGPPMI